MWGLDDGIHLFTLHPSLTGREAFGCGWHWDEVTPNWTFEKTWIEKPVKLVAYADCDEIEFFLNGKTLDRVPVQALKAEYVTAYHPGVLEARAWKGGRCVAGDTLETADLPAVLVLLPEPVLCAANGMDLVYIDVTLTDRFGRKVLSSDITIHAEVTGAATLMGIESGNPCTEENYAGIGSGNPCVNANLIYARKLYGGHALLCIRAGKEEGDAVIRVQSEGIPTARCILTIGEGGRSHDAR